MIAMIAGWLMSRNAALTLPYARRLAKIGLAGAALALLVGGFALWLALHDRGVIERHETEQKLEEASTALEGERRASTAGQVRDKGRAAADDQTEQQLEAIHAEDPDAAAAPASRGARAVADRLR